MTAMKTENFVCLLAFLSATCSGYLLLREKRSLLTREAQGNSTEKVSCSATIFACPKTPDSTLQSGNLSKGEDFLPEAFSTENCRYLKELNQCVEDNSAMIMSDPECAEMRIIASIVSSQNNKLCNSPLLQMLKELRTCYNSRYEDVISFMKRYEAMSEQSTEGVFCPSYRELVDDTVKLFKTCPDTQTLWTTESEETFRENFYPGVYPKSISFTCDGER